MDLLDPEGSDAASSSSSDGVEGEARRVIGDLVNRLVRGIQSDFLSTLLFHVEYCSWKVVLVAY